MKDTLIPWTDDTRNVVEGCTEVDEECERCYAKGIAARFSGVEGPESKTPGKPLYYSGLAQFSERRHLAQWTGQVRLCPDVLDKMFWTLLGTKASRRQFLCSMGDLGHVEVPDSYLDEVFARVAILESCRPGPLHIIQMLTKRPARMAAYTRAPDVAKRVDAAARRFVEHVQTTARRKRGARTLDGYEFRGWPLRGVHLITSAGRQVSADTRIPEMLEATSALVGVSCEPMLTEVDFRRWIERIGWLILGGESDREDPRLARLEWFYRAIELANDAGVPVFMKQTGTALARQLGLKHDKGEDIAELDEALRVRQFPAMPVAA